MVEKWNKLQIHACTPVYEIIEAIKSIKLTWIIIFANRIDNKLYTLCLTLILAP